MSTMGHDDTNSGAEQSGRGRSNPPPPDRLDDPDIDLTLAADSDVLREIRRRAGVTRTANTTARFGQVDSPLDGADEAANALAPAPRESATRHPAEAQPLAPSWTTTPPSPASADHPPPERKHREARRREPPPEVDPVDPVDDDESLIDKRQGMLPQPAASALDWDPLAERSSTVGAAATPPRQRMPLAMVVLLIFIVVFAVTLAVGLLIMSQNGS